MHDESIKWLSSAAVPSSNGEHYCEWHVQVEADGATATASAIVDLRSDSPTAGVMRKRFGAGAEAKLAELRADIEATTEAKAKRRALHQLGYTWEQAAELIGCGKGCA